MDPSALVKLISLMLWCHCAVLAVVWLRRLRRADREAHVGHVFTLVAGLLPVSVGLILMVFVGGVLDIPVLALLVFVLLPAGLDVALLMAVDDLGGASRRIEAGRLAAALALAGGIVALRGGL